MQAPPQNTPRPLQGAPPPDPALRRDRDPAPLCRPLPLRRARRLACSGQAAVIHPAPIAVTKVAGQLSRQPRALRAFTVTASLRQAPRRQSRHVACWSLRPELLSAPDGPGGVRFAFSFSRPNEEGAAKEKSWGSKGLDTGGVLAFKGRKSRRWRPRAGPLAYLRRWRGCAVAWCEATD